MQAHLVCSPTFEDLGFIDVLKMLDGNKKQEFLIMFSHQGPDDRACKASVLSQ